MRVRSGVNAGLKTSPWSGFMPEDVDVAGLRQHVKLRILLVDAVPDQVEQRGDGVVEVVAVAALLGGEVALLHHVAERFQAVAGPVFLALHGRVAQFRARLHEEEEEQAVQVAQTLPGEVVGLDLLQDALVGLAEIPDHLVAQQFHCFAGAVFQVLRNGKGVLVGVLAERIEQAGAFSGRDAVMVQQRGNGSPWAVVPVRRGSRRCRSAACASAPTCCGPGGGPGRC